MKSTIRKATTPASLLFIAACLTGCPSKKALDSLASGPPSTVSGPKAAKAGAEKTPDFEGAWTLGTTYDPKTSAIILSVELKNGFHAYGPGEQTGMPPAIDLEKTGGWELMVPPVLPRGISHKSPTGSDMVVLTDHFVIQARVNKGKGPIHGTLHLQLCTDMLCDRPRSHPFEVKAP